MSAPAAAAPPAAPAPSPPPPPPPAPPAAPAPAPAPTPVERGAEDPFLKSIFEDLGVVLESGPVSPPAAVPTPPAPGGAPTPTPPQPAAPTPPPPGPTSPVPAGGTPPAPAPAPAPAPVPPTEPPVVVRRDKPISKVVEDVLRKVMAETTPPPPAPGPSQPPPPPTPSPDDAYIASLGPEEKETIALAKWAEESDPAQKGLAGKFVTFYKAIDDYVNAERAKDPQRTFDDEDEAFTKFVEGARPQIEPAKWDELKRTRLIQQTESAVTQKVEEKFKAQIEDTRKRQKLLETKPIIEGRLKQFEANIGQMMNADTANPLLPNIAKAIEKDGVDKTIEADPIFTPIVVHAYGQGQALAAEFLAMTHGIKEYNPNNEAQDWVIRFIRRSGETFAATGGDKLVRQTEEGPKTFLPRGQYNQLLVSNPEQAQKHWTFSDEDILRMIERNTKDHIAAKVKAENDRLVKAGYVKPPPPAAQTVPGTANPPAPAAPTPPPEPVGSPRAGVSAAPGQGNGSVTQQQVMSDGELQLLGFPRK